MDLSNGASALFVKELFKGADIEWLCDTLDGSFPNHEPNPLVAENREMLRKHLLANKSDIGVIYDGDADRVMFIDENGRFVSPDLLIAILGHFFIEGKGTSKAAAAIRGKCSESHSRGEGASGYQKFQGSRRVSPSYGWHNQYLEGW